MSKQKVSKSKLQQVSTKEESIVSKAKSKTATKSATPVEKKVSTPKPTIASLTKELEDTKDTLKVLFSFKALYSDSREIIDQLNFEVSELNKKLALAQRPWYVKIFDFFAN